MANRPAPASVLRDGGRSELERWLRSSTAPVGLAQRARIVLLGADGASNEKTAELVGVSLSMVRLWRRRYLEAGLPGLDDAPRPGRPRTIDHRGDRDRDVDPAARAARGDALVLAPARHPAEGLSRDGGTGVALVWVQPWRAESFRFSTDPELVGKVT